MSPEYPDMMGGKVRAKAESILKDPVCCCSKVEVRFEYAPAGDDLVDVLGPRATAWRPGRTMDVPVWPTYTIPQP